MDKYYVYRPLLNLLGISEGTDRGRGYNETLGYGAYTNGAVDLVKMTLGQIDALQTKMLPNKLNSTALGRYQIIRTTLRALKKTHDLKDKELFNEDMQDRLASILLGQRGYDKYLSGRLEEGTLINNLAKEWASLPMTDGNSAYGTVKKGDIHVKQKASVTVQQVRAALAEGKKRHKEGQPLDVVVPEKVDTEVKKKFDLMQWISGFFGSIGVGVAAIAGMEWKSLLILCSFIFCGIGVLVYFRARIVAFLKELREELA